MQEHFKPEVEKELTQLPSREGVVNCVRPKPSNARCPPLNCGQSGERAQDTKNVLQGFYRITLLFILWTIIAAESEQWLRSRNEHFHHSYSRP